MYNTVYDLSFVEYGAVFLLVTVVSAVLLTLSYRNVEQGTHNFLSATRKTGYYSSAKNGGESEGLMYQESLAWSFFLNNAIFVGCFLFLAFYALRSVETLYNYVLSMVLSAAVAWQLSSSR